MSDSQIEIGVLADDLTGALASAACLKESGHHPVVVSTPEPLPQIADAVVVDMRTRDDASDRRAKAMRWAEFLLGVGCRHIDHRIDTSLRGGPAEELGGIRAALMPRRPITVAVAAFPLGDRITIDGRQHAAGEDLGLVGERVFPAERHELVPLRKVREGVEVVVRFVEDVSRTGATNFVADAVDESDIATLGRVLAELHRRDVDILATTSGAPLRYYRQTAFGSNYVLVALGSATTQNFIQLEYLKQQRNIVVLDALDLAADESAEVLPDPLSVDTVVVQSLTSPASGPANASRPGQHSRMVARAVRAVLQATHMRGQRCAGMVVSGGYTAAAVLDELSGTTLRCDRSAAPLCSTATISSGPWSGLSLATKGGMVGDRHTLADLVVTIEKEFS